MINLPVNFRAFLPISLSVIAAILCAYLYMINKTLGIALGCVLIVTLAILAVIFLLKHKYKKLKLRIAIAFFIATLLSVCSFSIAITSYNGWNNGLKAGGAYTVSGRVCAIDTRTGIYRFNLEELIIGGESADGIMRVTVKATDNNIAEFVECGDRLVFDADINAVELISDGVVDGSAYRGDIRYTTYVDGDKLIMMTGEPTKLESLMQNMRIFYVENMGEKYGNIAFSMITGDRYALDDEYSDYFSAAGLGHIMAVSGLHIGFLSLILGFVLCKLNNKIRFPIIIAVLLGYTVIADFSPSVVRAVIMAIVSGAAVFVGGRRDLLSSMLCALSLILAVKPFYLFEAGFLLSFGAMFGIAMFANSIKRFMVKRGAHNKVGNVIGATVSVSIGIAPVMMCCFGSVFVLSCFVNVATIPYIGIVFITIVCLTPIALIPGLGAVLKVGQYLLTFLDYIAYGIAQVPYASISVSSGVFVFVCYPIMFFGSEFFMMRKGKTAVVLYSAAVCIVICVICAIV